MCVRAVISNSQKEKRHVRLISPCTLNTIYLEMLKLKAFVTMKLTMVKGNRHGKHDM